jgi:hypothetical protein
MVPTHLRFRRNLLHFCLNFVGKIITFCPLLDKFPVKEERVKVLPWIRIIYQREFLSIGLSTKPTKNQSSLLSGFVETTLKGTTVTPASGFNISKLFYRGLVKVRLWHLLVPQKLFGRVSSVRYVITVCSVAVKVLISFSKNRHKEFI